MSQLSGFAGPPGTAARLWAALVLCGRGAVWARVALGHTVPLPGSCSAARISLLRLNTGLRCSLPSWFPWGCFPVSGF